MATRRGALRFWSSAVAVAVGLTIAIWFGLPYQTLQATAPEEKVNAWLLTVWTTGVMAILFGVAALIAKGTGLGVRDVARAGSLQSARDERRKAETENRPSRYGNFAWWLVASGGAMIAAYFVAWALTIV